MTREKVANTAPAGPPQTIEYSPEVLRTCDPPEPDFYGCPTVSDWDDTTPLVDGDEIVTTEQKITIVFGYGLPNLNLRSDHGFTRRDIVDAICKGFQAAGFERDHNFLETVWADDGLITFSLGS
jgi:hypothetical protein